MRQSFDEIVPLLVCRKCLEVSALLVGDDPAHILVQPFLGWEIRKTLKGAGTFDLFALRLVLRGRPDTEKQGQQNQH